MISSCLENYTRMHVHQCLWISPIRARFYCLRPWPGKPVGRELPILAVFAVSCLTHQHDVSLISLFGLLSVLLFAFQTTTIVFEATDTLHAIKSAIHYACSGMFIIKTSIKTCIDIFYHELKTSCISVTSDSIYHMRFSSMNLQLRNSSAWNFSVEVY